MGKRELKEDYYDEIYGGKGYVEQGGLVPWLYSHLKRYDEDRYRTVFSLLERGGKLLDVGCGDGYFCVMAKGIFNDVYGVEVSQVRKLDAEKKIKDRQDKGNFHFIQHDVDESLPFPDDFFDAITCIATLEYLIYPCRLILEVRRILKPGGYFIVQVNNFAFLPNRFTLLTGKLPTSGGVDEVGVDWERLHNYTTRVIVTLLKRSEFEVISLTCSGVFARIRRIWLSLLAGDMIVKVRRCRGEQKDQSRRLNDHTDSSNPAEKSL